MSSRAVTNRQILLNITNMDDNQQEIIYDKILGGGVDGGGGGGGRAGSGGGGGGDLRDVNGVKSVHVHPTTTTETLFLGGKAASDSPSCGENGNNLNKFESGSGSGEHEGGTVDDGIDTAAKKRKTRRGKPKHRKLKPYSKQQISYEERSKSRGGITSNRVTKANGGRQPPAPYNTTQFLMEDHSDLPDLEQKLAGAAAAGCGEALPIFQKPIAPPRTRDSSFSIDSDDDYFYSSPEDEEEFLTKEFSTAYEDLHAERLGGLTKSELIQEYIQLESKVDLLTKRLRGKNFHQMIEERDLVVTNDNNKYSATEIEIAKKLKIFQQRIDDLIQQNEQLRRENDALKGQRRGGGGGGVGACGSVASSVDSESDSDSTSDTSSCSCSGNSPIQSSATNVASSNSHIFIRREQKINGFNSDDEDTTINHSFRRSNDTSPKLNSNSNSNGNIISNGHPTTAITTPEVKGLPT